MRLGIFGGSFNPVHIGHLLVAEDIHEQLKLDKIIFIPAYNPPHKRYLLPFRYRFEMLKLAIEDNPFFELSDIEAKRMGKSFTIDTLSELKKEYPKDELYLIMGTDQFAVLSSWKEPTRLFEMARVVVISRPGFAKRRFGRYNPIFVPVIRIDIAGRQIRRRIAQNRSVRYMLPERVFKYIMKYNLYQKEGGKNV